MRLLNVLFLSVLLAMLIVLARVAGVQAQTEQWDRSLNQRTHAAIARSELLRAAAPDSGALALQSGELWLRVNQPMNAGETSVPVVAYAFEATASR